MNTERLADKAGDIRAGEELDIDRLKSYLEPVLGSKAATINVRQFPGGHSNLTYHLQSGEESWVMRRPPFGSRVKSAHDMSREYRILSALKDIYPYGPEPVHFCDDHEVIGCDFYLMHYIKGLVIRRQYPSGLDLSADQVRQQLFNFVDVLSDLHSVDLAAAGLENFGRPEGYVQRQIDGWCRRWSNSHTPDTVNVDNTMQWLQDRIPADSGRASVIHNDYKLDNVIFSLEDPLQVIGVLDWEMATVGDPLMDLGCTLGYWVQTTDPDYFRKYRNMPSDMKGAPKRKEIIERFQQRTGLVVDDFAFYFCFAVFRLCVVGQQIYYRYYHGHTKDERFAGFLQKAFVLQRMCEQIMCGEITE
ncbi:MAG: phosphotransferase family protein [Gammaproteobacteria bacterium]|nr:phosphotransferase family protein [Gammaproteobacteria bacterium]MCY4358161.1 phosphotransferase family protein [Gammaproteobacteria bacterium]